MVPQLEGNGLMILRYTDDCITLQSVAFTGGEI